MGDSVATEIAQIDTFRNDLIRKYGTVNTENDNIMIKTNNEDGTPTSDYINFSNEYMKLLNEEKELSYYPIKASYLDGYKPIGKYEMLYNFVEIDS